jgi:hypothetical protein
MFDECNGVLVRLSGSGQTVADPMDDVRGRPVCDESGARLGTIEDLLVDPARRRIRYLRVVRGGVLGWGVKPRYIPAGAVICPGATVLVQTSGSAGPIGPGYGPELAPETDDVDAGPARLAYAPYWVPGYLPPIYRRPYGGG